jgi:hypothetical protein
MGTKHILKLQAAMTLVEILLFGRGKLGPLPMVV